MVKKLSLLARCRVLISALADICLRRYIEKTCQGHGELSLKIQFRNSNVRELSENDKTQGTGISKTIKIRGNPFLSCPASQQNSYQFKI